MWLQTRRALRHKAIAQNDRASFHRAETIAVGPHASKPMQVRPRQAAHYLIAPTSDAVAVPFVRVSVQHCVERQGPESPFARDLVRSNALFCGRVIEASLRSPRLLIGPIPSAGS